MLIYRLCKEEEMLKILEAETITAVGRYCHNTRKLNTHVYKRDKKYLHFFLDEYEIINLNPKEGKYICTYDIPKDIVNEYLGYGYYRSIFDLDTLIKIPECAIPTELIRFSNLLKIERIKEYIDIESYLDDINKYKEVIYPKKSNNKIRRKVWKRKKNMKILKLVP